MTFLLFLIKFNPILWRPWVCHPKNSTSRFKQVNLIELIWPTQKIDDFRFSRQKFAEHDDLACSSGVLLVGYANLDWAGSAVDWKSTSGYCISMGSAMISWSSRNQGSIAQSTTEAEYIAARKQFGLGNYYLICSVESLTQRLFIAIIRVALSFQKIQCFTVDRNTLKWSTISSET